MLVTKSSCTELSIQIPDIKLFVFCFSMEFLSQNMIGKPWRSKTLKLNFLLSVMKMNSGTLYAVMLTNFKVENNIHISSHLVQLRSDGIRAGYWDPKYSQVWHKKA